jgi:antitoxin VapB
MALNIKNAETEKLVRELARRRGQGITEALTDVVRREVERERMKPRRADRRTLHEKIQEIVDAYNKLPVLDDRSPDELIGYNEKGLFD